MNFFKKLFSAPVNLSEEEIKDQEVALSLDDTFVHNFIKLGGKFLYCHKEGDVTKNISHILNENNWDFLTYKNADLAKFIGSVDIKTSTSFNDNTPLFTTCECLISENGSILFSSNQLEEKRLSTHTNDFIVLATTSQIVKNKGESLTGIKAKYKKNMPGNISPIKNYTLNASEDNFLNYGTNNSKNLYLLLLEDL